MKTAITCTNCGASITVDYEPAVAAVLNAPAERCHPAEPAEIEADPCPTCGEEIDHDDALAQIEEEEEGKAEEAAVSRYEAKMEAYL